MGTPVYNIICRFIREIIYGLTAYEEMKMRLYILKKTEKEESEKGCEGGMNMGKRR